MPNTHLWGTDRCRERGGEEKGVTGEGAEGWGDSHCVLCEDVDLFRAVHVLIHSRRVLGVAVKDVFRLHILLHSPHVIL